MARDHEAWSSCGSASSGMVGRCDTSGRRRRSAQTERCGSAAREPGDKVKHGQSQRQKKSSAPK
eukprot:9251391-Alexandrium_andersonii.AAC.1